MLTAQSLTFCLSHIFCLLERRETLLEKDVVDEVELVGEKVLDEDGEHWKEERPTRNLPDYSLQSSTISPHYLPEENGLGLVVRESVVNLDGVHDKDVADDSDDELRVPVGVARNQIQSN